MPRLCRMCGSCNNSHIRHLRPRGSQGWLGRRGFGVRASSSAPDPRPLGWTRGGRSRVGAGGPVLRWTRRAPHTTLRWGDVEGRQASGDPSRARPAIPPRSKPTSPGAAPTRTAGRAIVRVVAYAARAAHAQHWTRDPPAPSATCVRRTEKGTSANNVPSGTLFKNATRTHFCPLPARFNTGMPR